MNNKQFFVISLASVLLLSSCRTYKPVVSQTASGSPENDYINAYSDIAIMEMKRTGVPASITLAQGMIESNYGRSTLSREANNHFGIKCHNEWTGPIIRYDDDRKNECFRKYKSAAESFEDHSDFLKSGSRYSFLFDLAPTDYKGWARGLKKAGYATNPNYAEMLIRKIEENNLMIYDTEKVSGNSIKKAQVQKAVVTETKDQSDITASINNTVPAHLPRIMERNRIQYIVVRDGETREEIEEKFNLLRWELPKYNELDEDFEIRNGQILYLQPKREKAEPGQNTHIVNDGDTMYSISQKYGIKLKSLYELNRMEPGIQPKTGAKIWLRSLKPVE